MQKPVRTRVLVLTMIPVYLPDQTIGIIWPGVDKCNANKRRSQRQPMRVMRRYSMGSRQ